MADIKADPIVLKTFICGFGVLHPALKLSEFVHMRFPSILASVTAIAAAACEMPADPDTTEPEIIAPDTVAAELLPVAIDPSRTRVCRIPFELRGSVTWLKLTGSLAVSPQVEPRVTTLEGDDFARARADGHIELHMAKVSTTATLTANHSAGAVSTNVMCTA